MRPISPSAGQPASAKSGGRATGSTVLRASPLADRLARDKKGNSTLGQWAGTIPKGEARNGMSLPPHKASSGFSKSALVICPYPFSTFAD